MYDLRVGLSHVAQVRQKLTNSNIRQYNAKQKALVENDLPLRALVREGIGFVLRFYCLLVSQLDGLGGNVTPANFPEMIDDIHHLSSGTLHLLEEFYDLQIVAHLPATARTYSHLKHLIE